MNQNKLWRNGSGATLLRTKMSKTAAILDIWRLAVVVSVMLLNAWGNRITLLGI
jgi:hypothetical protein